LPTVRDILSRLRELPSAVWTLPSVDMMPRRSRSSAETSSHGEVVMMGEKIAVCSGSVGDRSAIRDAEERRALELI
jgi:hypothetical protein